MNRIILITVFTVLTFHVMAQEKVVQTAGRDQLGQFAPVPRGSTTMSSSASGTHRQARSSRSQSGNDSAYQPGYHCRQLAGLPSSGGEENGITRTRNSRNHHPHRLLCRLAQGVGGIPFAGRRWAEDTAGEDAKAAFQRQMIFPIGETEYGLMRSISIGKLPCRHFVGTGLRRNVTFEPPAATTGVIHRVTNGGGQIADRRVAGRG